MKVHLYKVIDANDVTCINDAMDVFTVMTEKELRAEFARARQAHRFPLGEYLDYARHPDYSKNDWDDLPNLPVGTMVDMMNDINNYNTNDCGYYITETDIEI